ncbi:MAG: polysaccharide pyruvyl transferase family protein [Vicinamibacterales bacterium]
MRALVAGWFSFDDMGASAGDILCRDAVSGWLRDADIDVVLATAPPFIDGVAWESVARESIDAVVFVCGPFGNGWPIPEFLNHFKGCPLVGVNLSMLQELKVWNPFDVLIERDSSRMTRPDVVFLCPTLRVPVAGVILVHPQREYGALGLHERANAALRALLDGRDIVRVDIDTRLDANETGLRSPAQVETLISRMDVVLTTRLHGTVLALKNGVPCVSIDPISGGAKIRRQADAIGWPYVFSADDLSMTRLREALDVCLSPHGRSLALSTAERAKQLLENYSTLVTSAVQGTRKDAR